MSRLSKQNVEFWSCIKTGDIRKFRQDIIDHDDVPDIHDVDGNNALMIACFNGQTQIAAELLIRQQKLHRTIETKNDLNKTPLIAAIQSKSIATIEMLLRNFADVQTTMDTVDCFGNTAALYASSTNNIDILKAIVHNDTRSLLDQINRKTGDTSLHIAARNGGSMEFIMYILQHVTIPKISRKKNFKGETFYHLCGNLDFIKQALKQQTSIFVDAIFNDIDKHGRSPLMTWAANGRLDLVETMISHTKDFSRVDKDGRTILHLIALHLGRHLVFGNNSLGYIVKKMRHVVNVRDWCHGNTALHIAAETSTLASIHNISNAITFIKAIVRYGAVIDAVNLRDEHAVNICRIPELTTCLDGKLYIYIYIYNCNIGF